MTYDEFNSFCATLPATSHVVQWGGSHVWKVGEKVFAIGGWNDGKEAFTFKVSDVAFEILKEERGLRPAPYLASRGMKWIQRYDDAVLDDQDLKRYLRESYRIVSLGLSKKRRRALGLNQPEDDGDR
ncbi:MAG: MmcQ/YjbR family DNA-binding protein [Bauldia sp.]|uniref:MmcQ/YjbR family DNA-binding protein n=1 Tax=Bauldia sp. TaxID=2575872 RepID=UPI001DC57504|nr:MmcQ/YjbR family DNA-binding protein [Bauldia sp.]MCB1494379.1 MmcQ/YjbR family DNA-binding protein [Bauldia sp.]